MADRRPTRVELTASFVERLESIGAFLTDAAAPQAYDELLDGLRRTVIPNRRGGRHEVCERVTGRACQAGSVSSRSLRASQSGITRPSNEKKDGPWLRWVR